MSFCMPQVPWVRRQEAGGSDGLHCLPRTAVRQERGRHRKVSIVPVFCIFIPPFVVCFVFWNIK